MRLPDDVYYINRRLPKTFELITFPIILSLRLPDDVYYINRRVH